MGVDEHPQARVAIVDDHPITGESLELRLRAAGFDVVATVPTVEDPALAAPADVVVCDLRLPGRSGAAAVAWLTDAGWRVLATSGVASRDEVLDVVAAGARGFVPKTSLGSIFVDAVSTVASDQLYLSAELAGFFRTDAQLRPLPSGDVGAIEDELLGRLEQGDTPAEVAYAMRLSQDRYRLLVGAVWAAAGRRRRELMPSQRERDVMRLVSAGAAHKDVARQLAISVATVPDHLRSIKAKYVASHPDASPDIKPTVAAAKWAAELGMSD